MSHVCSETQHQLRTQLYAVRTCPSPGDHAALWHENSPWSTVLQSESESQQRHKSTIGSRGTNYVNPKMFQVEAERALIKTNPTSSVSTCSNTSLNNQTTVAFFQGAKSLLSPRYARRKKVCFFSVTFDLWPEIIFHHLPNRIQTDKSSSFSGLRGKYGTNPPDFLQGQDRPVRGDRASMTVINHKVQCPFSPFVKRCIERSVRMEGQVEERASGIHQTFGVMHSEQHHDIRFV